MLATIYAAQVHGLVPQIIVVEIDISRGLYNFSIVGLADKIIDESKERLNAAIKNAGFTPPQRGNRKIIASLAPANTKKEGSFFDMAIAMGFLKATKQTRFDETDKLFVGELSLDGSFRPIDGILLITQSAKKHGFRQIFVPHENAKEAALISGINVYGVSTLAELAQFLNTKPIENTSDIKKVEIPIQPPTKLPTSSPKSIIDFSDIRGQEHAKRALEIAAAGRHNICMMGPPGTGKTLLAKAFCGIMPALTFEETLAVTGIHSVAGKKPKGQYIIHPPFQAPHHTASYVSLVGGGTSPKPGIITLSHKGVLFLDEFPEFEKRVVEALRQPLEDKVIHISRAKESMIFPADFMLVAAANPCPCGYYGSLHKECNCTGSSLERYRRKLSGPIIDRIDLWTTVSEVSAEKLSQKKRGENSGAIRKRVIAARKIQKKWFNEHSMKLSAISNASARELDTIIKMGTPAKEILNASVSRLGLSARAYHKVMKIAFTIASLSGETTITKDYMLEALQFRPKEMV